MDRQRFFTQEDQLEEFKGHDYVEEDAEGGEEVEGVGRNGGRGGLGMTHYVANKL